LILAIGIGQQWQYMSGLLVSFVDFFGIFFKSHPAGMKE
jgi:hypothetical protein